MNSSIFRSIDFMRYLIWKIFSIYRMTRNELKIFHLSMRKGSMKCNLFRKKNLTNYRHFIIFQWKFYKKKEIKVFGFAHKLGRHRHLTYDFSITHRLECLRRQSILSVLGQTNKFSDENGSLVIKIKLFISASMTFYFLLLR